MKVIFLLRYVILCVVSFSLLQVHTALAQGDKFEAGYIITAEGDSLNGFVLVQDNSLNATTCRFKQSTGGEIKTYSPNGIKVYGVGTKKRFASYAINSDGTSENVFVSCLVKGKVSLYYFNERYFLDSRNGFKELTTSTTTVTRDGKTFSQELPVYKGVLQTEMNDCSSIHENLKGTALKKNDLTKLFVDYHKCVGKSATVYESGAGKIKVAVGIALSGQSTAFDIQSGGNVAYLYLDNNDPMKDFTFAPTFVAEFYSSEGKGRFRVRTGLSYFTGKYHMYDQGSPGTLDHELTINMARIELPVMLKYYPFKNAGFYLSAGLGFNLSVKWEQKNVTIVPPSAILSENSDLKNNSFFTNPMGGLGFDFPIGKRKLFIEGIYGQSQSVLSSSKTPTSKFNSITFTTGIVF